MKNVLLKLANGINDFECTIFGQPRNCEIIELDLRCYNDNKGRALVKFNEPVKKIVRREVENPCFGMDSDESYFEDVEVDSYEEWITIGC